MNYKYIKIISKKILKYYLLYALIFGVLIFAIYRPKENKYEKIHTTNYTYQDNYGQDRIALVEDRYDSGIVRVNLIENAENTLDISYYTLINGVSTKIFLGSILEAADRGVEVRILLDGIFHNLKGELKDTIYAFSNHPNIQLKFYEPFNFLIPWSWNNRLHDKIMIVDSNLAIIGGRNIGDRYFAKSSDDNNLVNDRDVVILNSDIDNYSNSVIFEMEKYFNDLWNHKLTKYPIKRLSKRKIKKGVNYSQYLKDNLEEYRKTNYDIFKNNIHWYNKTLPVKNINFVHNPIGRFNKEPLCLDEILNLASQSKESIFIQSPYIIPSRNIVKEMNKHDINVDNIDILTNSFAASPNYFGISGYANHRKKIVDLGMELYEYQGPESIHGKTYIFDEKIAVVGSFNFDPRSSFLNTESLVTINSPEFVELIQQEIDKQIVNSLKVGEDYSYISNNIKETTNLHPFKKIAIKAISKLVYFLEFLL